MIETLQNIVGGEGVVVVDADHPNAAHYHPHPLPLVHAVPSTREQVVEVVKAAARDGFAIVPVGGNSSPRVAPGGVPAVAARDGRPLCLLSLEMIERVIAHEPGDLTLTAEAGLALAEAQKLLRRSRQFLPLAVPARPRATLGGIVATADDGPWAARFGPVRDSVLGITVVHGDGRVTKAGGRVVKNVTGYDLCRLHTGARGTLGIILEMTLRLRPVPEGVRHVCLSFDDAAAAHDAAWLIRQRAPTAAAVLVLTGAAVPRDDDQRAAATVVVTIAGVAPFVAALAAEISALPFALAPHDIESVAGSGPDPWLVVPPAELAVVRVTARTASWRELAPTLDALLPESVGAVHDVLTGTRETWHIGPSPLTFPQAAPLDAALRLAGASLDCPRDPAFHGRLAALLPSCVPGGLTLMKQMRAALDPDGVINPARTLIS